MNSKSTTLKLIYPRINMITKEERIKIINMAIFYLKNEELSYTCSSIVKGFKFVTKIHSDELDSDHAHLIVPEFNFPNVKKICEENNLILPINKFCWWDIAEKETRIKVLEIIKNQILD